MWTLETKSSCSLSIWYVLGIVAITQRKVRVCIVFTCWQYPPASPGPS
jgi:hypothetical protein